MKRFTMTTNCDVCGGKGETTGNPYIKGFRSHTDPRVCFDNIKREKQKLKELQLKE